MYHDECALCHCPPQLADAWYFSTETFKRVWIVDGSKKHLKKICPQLSSLALSGFKSLRKPISKAQVLMSAFKGFKLTTG